MKPVINKTIFLTSTGILAGLIILYLVYLILISNPQIKLSQSNTINEKSLIVLPLGFQADSSKDQYFECGMVEDIIDNLFKIKNLKVFSRTTTEYFTRKKIKPEEIARILNVRYILETNVYRNENNVEVLINITDCTSGKQIFSRKFPGVLADIFILQSEITEKVANALSVTVSQEDLSLIEKVPTTSQEAYDYYLRGRFLFNRAIDLQSTIIARNAIMESIRFYEKATVADTSYADAFAGLADSWFTVSVWNWYKPFDEGLSKAKNYAQRALELDHYCAEGHLVKGACLIWADRRYEEGRLELIVSQQLDPNFAIVHQYYTQLLMVTGPISEARRYLNLALEKDPYFWIINNLNAVVYLFEGKYKESENATMKAIGLKPDYVFNNWLLFLNYSKSGQGTKAAEELQNILRISSKTEKYDSEIINAFNKSGIDGLFSWLIGINTSRPIPALGLNGQPLFVSWWHAVIGNKEQSLRAIQKYMESQNHNYTYFNLIPANPDFFELRSDPRFIAIIEQIGLKNYNSWPAR
jgi:TolB-like protein